MLTLLQLQNDVEHQAGGAVDARIDPIAIANEAGRYLFSLASWKFRQRPPAPLNYVANQQWVALPDDFGNGEIDSLVVTNAVIQAALPASLSQIQNMRSTVWIVGFNIYYAIVQGPQADVDEAPPAPRLEIYPTPGADQTAALTLNYRAGWIEMTDNNDVANIPVTMEHLLRRIVRAITKGYVKDDYSDLDGISKSDQFMQAKRADGATQAMIGRMTGGIVDNGVGSYLGMNFNTSNL